MRSGMNPQCHLTVLEKASKFFDYFLCPQISKTWEKGLHFTFVTPGLHFCVTSCHFMCVSPINKMHPTCAKVFVMGRIVKDAKKFFCLCVYLELPTAEELMRLLRPEATQIRGFTLQPVRSGLRSRWILSKLPACFPPSSSVSQCLWHKYSVQVTFEGTHCKYSNVSQQTSLNLTS